MKLESTIEAQETNLQHTALKRSRHGRDIARETRDLAADIELSEMNESSCVARTAE
jgi:hypothetical protein